MKEDNLPPAFSFYAQDFLTGVIYLTNEEVGIYVKMIAKQWTDKKVPKKRLKMLIGYEWEELSSELKEKFVDKGDYVINKRLEKERIKKSNFIERQKENGKKGGRPKKTQNKPKPFEWDNPNHNPNESQKNPLEDEIEIEVLNNKVRIQKFEKFYELYPRHKGNIRMVKDMFMELEDEEVEKIEKTLKDFLKDKEPRYIPFSEKYLEDRRWNDKNLLSSDNPFKGQVAR